MEQIKTEPVLTANLRTLTIAYFLVASLEIAAEFTTETSMIYIVKPMLMPLLILIYWQSSDKRDIIYMLALVFSMAASFFFISGDIKSIQVGAIFFFIHRSLIIWRILYHIKLPGLFPLLVGCVPFFFIYMSLVNMTFDKLGDGLYIFIAQCLLVSFMGGLAVGSYILHSNKTNRFLLLSTLLFALTQFIFVIRLYYFPSSYFQPLAMLMFVIAQYLFYKFLVRSENGPETDEIYL